MCECRGETEQLRRRLEQLESRVKGMDDEVFTQRLVVGDVNSAHLLASWSRNVFELSLRSAAGHQHEIVLFASDGDGELPCGAGVQLRADGDERLSLHCSESTT